MTWRAIIRPALIAALLIGAAWPGPVTAGQDRLVYRLQVDGLACPFCAYGIEKQLNRIAGVDSVRTDIKSGTVVVTMTPGARLKADDAKRAVEAAGFTLRGFLREDAAA